LEFTTIFKAQDLMMNLKKTSSNIPLSIITMNHKAPTIKSSLKLKRKA
jgi:hypothetical protein